MSVKITTGPCWHCGIPEGGVHISTCPMSILRGTGGSINWEAVFFHTITTTPAIYANTPRGIVVLDRPDPCAIPRISAALKAEAISFNEMAESVQHERHANIAESHEWQRAVEQTRWSESQKLNKVRSIYFEESDE